MLEQEAVNMNWEDKVILIVEDEEINYLYIETLLQKTGAQVMHAWNGQQAIDIVKDNPSLDLVLMDIKMPIMDGYRATEYIKQFRPGLPVIAQTAYTLGDDKLKCLDAGCDDYVSKPIRRNILYEIITNQFSKSVKS
ncbi:MAG TPA: response regulator [Bacteroidales bacterium]|nr:response regulator [Bacteroidales bacterium]